MVYTVADIQEEFRPIAESIKDIVNECYRNFLNSGYGVRWEFARDRASFINAEFKVIAEEKLLSTETYNINSRIIDHTVYYWLNDKYVFRFKKADRNGLSSNIPTKASLAYTTQGKHMAGLGVLPRFDICHIPNDLGTAANDILVVARNGKSILFKFSLLDLIEDKISLLDLKVESDKRPRTKVNIKSNDSGSRKKSKDKKS